MSTNEHHGLAELEAIVATMQPGEWREISETQAPWLTKVEHDAILSAAPEGAHGFWGVVGPSGVIRAFSGAELDPSGYRWFFKGGGHNAYGGNEVYQFSFDTLTWERLTEPSAYDPETKFPYEGPTSRHTYDALAWNPITETLWVGGRSAYVPGQHSSGPVEKGVWEFDPDTREWTLHEHDLPAPMQMTFNPETGRLFGLYGIHSNNDPREYEPDGTLVPVNYGSNMGVWDASAGLLTAKGKMYYFGQGDGSAGNHAILEVSGGTNRVLLDEWPQEVLDVGGQIAGIAYDEVHDRFVIWGGDNRLWTWSFEDAQMRRFDLANIPPYEDRMGIQDKFVYLPAADAFATFVHRNSNVWLLKAPLPEDGVLVDPNAPRAKIGDQAFTSIQDAFDAAKDGDTVTILPGVWREAATVKANNLTIEGHGAHLKDSVADGKATLVIQGDNTTIRGLEVSGMSVGDGNGAAIRQEGRNLFLDGVYFHDGQQGILAGDNPESTIIVEDSAFERLGHGGRAHGIYVNKIAELIIRDSQFLASKGEGHEIKSRAAKTTIENSVVASLDGNDSRLIDIPNGGEIVIRNNVLQMGAKTANPDAIGINLEQRNPNNAHDWPENTILIEGNIILDDRGGNSRLLHYRDWEDNGYPAPVLVGNTVVGFSSSEVPSGNTWHANRDAAGLPPYPFLPEAPVADGAAPTANDDEAALPENGAVTIAVLANDVAAGDGPLQVVAVGDPAHGTATLNADSTITYVPDADFYGTDTFVYWVSEGSGAAVGAVSLTVEPGSKVRLSDDSTITAPDEAVTVDVLGNDYHIDGAALTVTELGSPSFGTAGLNDDGTVTYTPNDGFTGTDMFSYTVSDGQGGEATANVEVSVEVPGTVVSAFNVGGGALSYDGTAWGADAYFSGNTQARNQSWAVEGTDNDALYQTYRFGADFSYAIPVDNGNYTVTLQFVETWWDSAGKRLFDIHLEDEERVSGLDVFEAAGGRYVAHDIVLPVLVQDGILNIDFRGQAGAPDKNALISGIVIETAGDNALDSNQAPVAGDDHATTMPGQAVILDLLANDHDPDGDALTTTRIGGQDAIPGAWVVLDFGIARLNSDGTVTYRPDAVFLGTESFSYEVSDGHGGTAAGRVNVDVTFPPPEPTPEEGAPAVSDVPPVNTPPVAADDHAATTPGRAVTIDVLGNDHHADGDALTVTAINGQEAEPGEWVVLKFGLAKLNADGTLTYRPDAVFLGEESFAYEISDGQGGHDEAMVHVDVDFALPEPVVRDNATDDALLI